MKKAILLLAGLVIGLPSLSSATIMSIITAPGQPNKSIQWNDGGVFKGSATMTYDKATGILSIATIAVTNLSATRYLNLPKTTLQSPATGPYNLNGFGISQSSGIELGAAQLTTVLSTIAAAIDLLNAATAEISIQESPDIGNLTYFLHNETTGYGSLYRLMSSSPSVDAEVSKTVNVPIAGNLVRISSHITLGGDPGVTKLPAGVWSFTSWTAAATLANVAQLVIVVSTTNKDGSNISEIVSSTSPAITETVSERFDMVAIQRNDIAISTDQRILVQYFGRTTSVLGVNMTLYFAGTTRFSHLTAPLGGVFKFTQLSDIMPPTYAGQAGKYVTVNSTETGLQFTTLPASGGSAVRPSSCVVVGPAGALGVDAYITSTEQFNLILATFGMCGLTLSATAQGCIMFQDGNYKIPLSTNPAGSTIICGSSVNFQNGGTATTLMTNYGKVGTPASPCNIDAGGTAFASQFFVAKSYSYQNVTFVGGQNQAQVASTVYPAKYSLFSVRNSSFTTGDLWFKEFRTPGADSAAGLSTLATWTIDNSANCIFRVHTSSYNQGSTSGGNGQQFLTITGSTMCEVYGNYDQVGTGWINLSRNSIFNHIWGGYMKVAGPGSAMQNVNGDMMVVGLNNYNEGIGASSANVFGPFEVHVVGDISSWNPQVFRAGANGATDKNPWYTEFRDISVYCENPAGNLTGVFLGSDARKTAIINVHTFGCATSVNNGATGTVGDSYLNNVRTTY